MHLDHELIWGCWVVLERLTLGGGSPGVWGLLGAAPLQLLHQHLTAAPQSIPELPKGATAPQ